MQCSPLCLDQQLCTADLMRSLISIPSTEFPSFNSPSSPEKEQNVAHSSKSPPPKHDKPPSNAVTRHINVTPKLTQVVSEFVTTLKKITTEIKGDIEELKVVLSARIQLGCIPNAPSADDVDKADGISRLFSLFNIPTNWVDLDRLEQLIKHSECEPARALMGNYKAFLTQHITDCFSSLVSPMVDGTEPKPDSQSAKVQFVFEDEHERKRLCELLAFKKLLIGQFGIRKEEIEFVSACLGGSLITTWLVALFIGWTIWYKLHIPSLLHFLRTEGVVEVKFICKNHILTKATHDRGQDTDGNESDRIGSAVESDPLWECLTHEGEKLDLFCANPYCNIPVCCKCAEESHRTHTIVPFANVNEERLAEVIKGHVGSVTMNYSHFQRVSDEEKSREQKIEKDARDAKRKVHMWEEEMIEAIHKRGQALSKEIEETAQKRRKLNQRQMLENADFLQRLYDAKEMGGLMTRQMVTKAELLGSASTISSQLIKMNAQCAIRKTSAIPALGGFGYSTAQDEQEELKSSISHTGCISTGAHPPNTKTDVKFPCRLTFRQGEEFILKVTLYDRNNRQCRKGGDCITGGLHPLVVPGPPIEARVKDHRDGTYTVLFRELYLGECKVVILVNGQPISEEPACVRIVEEDTVHASEQESTKKGSIAASELHFPDRPSFLRGIAISEDGIVCVSDRERHTVHIFDSHLRHVRCIRNKGDEEGQLKSPRNLAFSKDGELIVTCTDRVDVLTLDGQFVRRFASEGKGKVSDACDIAVRSNGQVYIADYGNDRIAVYEEDGSFLASIGEQGTGPGQLSGPKGVAFYKDERLVVSDHGNNRLQVFTPEGEYISQFGSYGTGVGHFNHPLSLAVTDEGFILVPEYNNNRISIHTLTGDPLLTWNGDGESPRGPFNRPTAIAMRAKGECFVVETTGVHVLHMPEIPSQALAMIQAPH